MNPDQPNNQYGSQPSPSPYDFINNSQPPKKPLFDHNSTKARIFLVVGGIFGLFFIAGIVTTVLSSAGKAEATNLKTVYAEQQEIIRISELGLKDALSSDARAFASTVNLSLKADQQKVSAMLGKRKVKIKNEEVNAKKSSKTDEQLSSAKAANRYDEAVTEILNKHLASYQQNLDSAHKSIGNQDDKTELETMYSSSVILASKDE